jgi:hypothetical protein
VRHSSHAQTAPGRSSAGADGCTRPRQHYNQDNGIDTLDTTTR